MLTELKNGCSILQADVLRGVAADLTQPMVSLRECHVPQLLKAVREAVHRAETDCQDWGADVVWLFEQAGYVPVLLGEKPVTLESQVVLPVFVTVRDDAGVPATTQFGLVVRVGFLAAIGSEEARHKTEGGKKQEQKQRLRLHYHARRGRMFVGASDGSEPDDGGVDVTVEPDIALSALDPAAVSAFFAPAEPPPVLITAL